MLPPSKADRYTSDSAANTSPPRSSHRKTILEQYPDFSDFSCSESFAPPWGAIRHRLGRLAAFRSQLAADPTTRLICTSKSASRGAGSARKLLVGNVARIH